MARTKVDNKLNVVIGTKAQVEADNTIPENSIVVVTDEVNENSGLTVEVWDTATKTLILREANKLFVCTSTNNQTLTIPTNASVPFPIGTMITFLLTSTYTVTFVGASGVNIWSIDSLVELSTPSGMASLIKIGENTWQLVGALE